MKRRLHLAPHLALAVSALAVSALAATSVPGSEPPGTDPIEAAPSAASAEFRDAAARRCTDAINSHPVEDPELTTVTVSVEIIEAEAADATPTAEQIDGWIALLDGELGRLAGIRRSLAELQSEEPNLQSAWATVIAANDPRITSLEARIDLLETGDWAAIADGYVSLRDSGDGGAVDAGAVETALATLDLGASECLSVFSELAAGARDESHPFRSEVALACRTIVERRLANGYDADAELTLNTLASLLTDETMVLPDGLAEALDHLSQEWQSTTDDFAAVDVSAAPDADGWQGVLDAAAERITIFANRATAVRAGDEAGIRAAFDTSLYAFPGLDFEGAGLGRRCIGVSA